MENRRKPCMTRPDLQCQCGLLWQAVISGLSFDKGNLVETGKEACCNTKRAYRKVSGGWYGWVPFSPSSHQKARLSENGGLYNKVARWHQMTHTVMSCPVLSLFLVLSSSHSRAHHFCLSFFLPFFLSSSSAFLLPPTLNASPSFVPWTEPKSSLLPQADGAPPNRVLLFLSVTASQLSDFMSPSFPFPMPAVLPPLWLMGVCTIGKFWLKYLQCVIGKSNCVQLM